MTDDVKSESVNEETETVNEITEVQETEQEKESTDVKDNKGMALLAYIIFFIPLIAAKESEFAMYHANQGLILFIIGISTWIIGTIIPIIGWLVILPLGTLLWFILLIVGIINAANGKKQPLPLVGSFKLIK